MSSPAPILLCVPASLRHEPAPVTATAVRHVPLPISDTPQPPNTVIVAATAARWPEDAPALPPLFLLLPARERTWLAYTLMSYTGDDHLYIRLPGPALAGDPDSPHDRNAWTSDLAARHRAHGGQLNNHRCWFRNLLPGLEAEHKFTLPSATDIWRLATLTHQHIRNGSLPGWICEHGNNGGFEQWHFTNHLFEITEPPAERGYIAFIPAIDTDGWIIRRKRYQRDQAIRREDLVTAPGLTAGANLRQVIHEWFGLTPAWGATYRRVRYNTMLESLASGHIFSIMYDRSTSTRPGRPPLVQAEVEYIRSRTLQSATASRRALWDELSLLITWTRSFLACENVPAAEDHVSKLTWLRQQPHTSDSEKSSTTRE